VKFWKGGGGSFASGEVRNVVGCPSGPPRSQAVSLGTVEIVRDHADLRRILLLDEGK
jgi:hypothetical protein